MSRSRAITRGVLSIAALVLAAGAGLLAGIDATLNQSRLFFAVRDAKRVLVPQKGGVHDVFNAHGQLVGYANGKTEIDAPTITPRTIVAFVFGQSNAANHGGERFVGSDARVVHWFDGHWYQGADPLLGASGIGGSPWVAMANRLVADGVADRVVLIAAAVNGSSIWHWRARGTLHPMLRERLDQVAAAGIGITHFLWQQGESDIATAPDDYKAGVLELIALARERFPRARFLVAQTSRCFRVPPQQALRDAQRSLTTLPGAAPGPDTDAIGPDGRYDDCHLSGRGLARIGGEWAAAVAAAPAEGKMRSASAPAGAGAQGLVAGRDR